MSQLPFSSTLHDLFKNLSEIYKMSSECFLNAYFCKFYKVTILQPMSDNREPDMSWHHVRGLSTKFIADINQPTIDQLTI